MSRVRAGVIVRFSKLNNRSHEAELGQIGRMRCASRDNGDRLPAVISRDQIVRGLHGFDGVDC